MINFDELASIMDNAEFEEIPVDLETFCYSEQFLGLKRVSEYQMQCLKAMTQIYSKETLVNLLGEEDGNKRYKQTNREVILQLGKGSGKDFMSTVAVAYIVHQLLCLTDPAPYYGKPKNDAIDILNIAINATQAKNVFFKGLKRTVENCPWFNNGPNGKRYYVKADSIEFDKHITCHSGHSEREAWEGYNVIVVILDEISGFSLDSTSGNSQAKTAADIHKMYKASVSSRFPEFGKTLLLSFPRFKGDYIQQKYEEAISSKDVYVKEHTFTLNEELTDDFPNNKLTIEWEEDQIKSYAVEKTFCMKRPTWEVNPTIELDSLKGDFFIDSIDALSRFACMPPDSVDGFFRNRDKVELAFSNPMLAVDSDGSFNESFKPRDGVEYFIHVDLAQKHDHCAVAMAHVDGWTTSALYEGSSTTIKPRVIVDMLMWWTPTKENVVALDTVRDFIIDVHNRGFRPKLVTFDRWNSIDIIKELSAYGVPSNTFSVKKSHYQDFFILVAEERVKGPYVQLLIDELMGLRIIKDRIDHPRTGSKDLSDAVCGAISNAIIGTIPDWDGEEISIVTLEDFQKPEAPEKEKNDGVTRAPKLDKSEMNQDISEYLKSLSII